MNKRRLIPLFTAFVLWGSQYVVSKVALRTIPPVTLLALRYLVSIPALLLVLRLRRALKPVDRRDWPILFGSGRRRARHRSSCACALASSARSPRCWAR